MGLLPNKPYTDSYRMLGRPSLRQDEITYYFIDRSGDARRDDDPPKMLPRRLGGRREDDLACRTVLTAGCRERSSR